jgi:hypothetical protein
MTPTSNREQAARLSPLQVGVFFLVTRLSVFFLLPPNTDVLIYAHYAWEHKEAARRGVPFYDYHAARAIGEARDVEYPPLAVAMMRIPGVFVGDAGDSFDSFKVRYYLAFRVGMVFVDGLLLVLFLLLLGRLFPDASRGEKWHRLQICQACLLALWHLLYDRLDLVQTVLTLAALALLTARLHWIWSFIGLAVAVHFKLVPVILAPVWVVGAIPAGQPLPRVLLGLSVRSALLVGLIGLGMAVFYGLAGERSLDFLAYHRARPLEIGSLAATLPLTLSLFGYPISVHYSYGSINLDSTLTPTLVALAPWATAGLLGAATILLVIHFRRLFAGVPPSAGVNVSFPLTLAQLHPLPMVSYSLLFLMLFIATNKVFSPQYLLWLAPLVALVPLRGRERWLFGWAFFLVCVLTTLLAPFLFMTDLMVSPTDPRDLKHPTSRLVVLLVIRNLLFLALPLWLAVHLIRQAGQGMPDEGELFDTTHARRSTTGTQK